MKLLITLLVTLGISMGSYGAFETGSDLLSNCESEANVHRTACLGYVWGVVDTYQTVMKHGFMPATICIPNQVTVGQQTEVVVKYLNEHPEDLHYRATGEVYSAIKEAYPCKD